MPRYVHVFGVLAHAFDDPHLGARARVRARVYKGPKLGRAAFALAEGYGG